MKLLFTLLLLSTSFLTHAMENDWQDIWLTGLEFLENKQYIEAKEIFTLAVSKMSEEEIQETPDVLINLAHTNYILGNFDDTLRQAKELVTSRCLSDQQRLICGNLIVSSLWQKGEEEKAVQAYFEYMASSPIVPKCYFREDRIIINNVPSCKIYKNSAKSFFIKEFCKNDEDFREYGDVWAINVTKKCDCYEKKTTSYQPYKRVDNKKRTPEAIRACCNTCSTLAVGGVAICGRFPNYACKIACTFFIETLRQIGEGCCYNGGYEEKCWENFSFWKDSFHDKNPKCPHPNDCL